MMLRSFLQTEFNDPRSRFIPGATAPEGDAPSPGTVEPTAFDGGWLFNLFDLSWWEWLLAATGIGAVLSFVWSLYVVLAYLFSLLLLVLYVYASVQKKYFTDLEAQILADNEALYQQYFNPTAQPSRLAELEAHIASDNPNDWKLAIIEADILLDETLKDRGYAGASLGERLRSISPAQLQSLNDAWEAHKVRNQIAHEGADFVLTERLARETIARYRRVFDEFGLR